MKLTKFLWEILFPAFCLNCQKEGSYLCEDCFSLIDILKRQYCPFCSPPRVVIDGKTCNQCKRTKKLKGLYCAVSYNESPLVKKMINQFKYQPFLKELAKPLASLILAHFLNLEPVPNFKDFLLIPVPLHKTKLKWRGFNHAEEISKELSRVLRIPVLTNVLIKIKKTPAQVELKKEQRKENIKNVFLCQKKAPITNKKILLIDDVFTTGSTLEECARTLKRAGAKEVWGAVVARG